jgi:alpha-glucoside transport system permease protein
MTSVAVPRAKAETPAARIVRGLNRWPVHLSLIVVSLVWLLPTVGLLVNSFRPPADISRSGWWTAFSLPFDFTLVNYEQVLTRNGLDTAFLNSLFISIPATLIPIAIAAFAAYAFSWMEFPGRNVLFIIVVGLLVVPLQSTFIPVLNLYAAGGLAGTFLGIWLAHTGYGLPFSVYLLRNFMGALPKEVFESAQIDGASHVTSFFRLALPMSVPALASLAIFQFLWVWNDLLVALIYLGPSGPRVLPLTVVVANLVNSLGGQWQLLTAAAFISMILPLIVFFSLQRYFVRGILGGSVKG